MHAVPAEAGQLCGVCGTHFFDGITSYNLESMTERKWLRRILFLETVAGKAFLGLKDET